MTSFNFSTSGSIDLAALAKALQPYLTQAPPVAAPPVVTPPVGSGNVFWLYHSGVKTLAGDFTQQGTAVDYHDPNGILFTSSAPYGLYLPYFAANYVLPNPGWKSFLISVKTTIPGENWKLYFEKVGDIPTGVSVVLAPKYGPAHVPGQWGSYVVPLADLGVAGDAALYKCGLQSSYAGNTKVYFNDLGLQ